MRGRVIAAFVVGFAIGALCIGAALWSTGKVQTAYLPPWVQRVPATPPAPAVPDMSSVPSLPETPVPPPEGVPTAAQGSADRAADRAATDSATTASPATTPAATTAPATLHPAAPHLSMPLAGLDVNKLTDTFDDARDGHKHEALDIMAPKGTPVLAVAEGNVAKLFTSKQGGLTVYQFDNTQQYAYYYAHLDRYATGLKEGMLLRKGDTLGFVGTTGDAAKNAPHLHFAVFKMGPEKNWWKGQALDPLPMLK
jgi:peptidoglycan LD-endopeptidase LytH